MIVGVDPGATTVGLAILEQMTNNLRLVVCHGATTPRKTKANPDPPPLNPYIAARELAQLIWTNARMDDTGILYVEGPAIGKFGRQDTLAAARQALFDIFAERQGTLSASARFRPVSPMAAKKALCGYATADKRRMREAAEAYIRATYPACIPTWDAFGEREKEAAADALAVLVGGHQLKGRP